MKNNKKISNAALVENAVEIIMAGGIVCIPTETVYGIICSADIPSAIAKMADIKQRPANKPFALFTPSWDRFAVEAVSDNSSACRLAEKFWPGPLTLVVEAREDCPCVYNGAVGVRCPKHELVLAILEKSGGLLANSSLNVSGEDAVWSLDGMGNFLDSFDLVIDCGLLPRNPSSTVVDCRKNPPAILREGIIILTEIEHTLLMFPTP